MDNRKFETTYSKIVKESESDFNAVRFREIMDEMSELLDEALELIPRASISYDRAHSYWYAHIQGAIDKNESEFLGGSMFDMAETLEELENEKSDEEDEDDDGYEEIERLKKMDSEDLEEFKKDEDIDN